MRWNSIKQLNGSHMGYVENYQLSWSIHMKKLGKKTLIRRRKRGMDRVNVRKVCGRLK